MNTMHKNSETSLFVFDFQKTWQLPPATVNLQRWIPIQRPQKLKTRQRWAYFTRRWRMDKRRPWRGSLQATLNGGSMGRHGASTWWRCWPASRAATSSRLSREASRRSAMIVWLWRGGKAHKFIGSTYGVSKTVWLRSLGSILTRGWRCGICGHGKLGTWVTTRFGRASLGTCTVVLCQVLCLLFRNQPTFPGVDQHLEKWELLYTNQIANYVNCFSMWTS